MMTTNDFDARREEILSAPLSRIMIKLALPTMGSAFLDTLYSFLDSLWLGGLGSSSVSAPMLTLTVLWLLFSIFGGIINGAFPFISQNRGAGRDEDARKAAGQAMFLASVIMLPLILSFFYLLPYIATFFGLESAFREDFIAYASIVIFSDIALGIAQMGLGLIRLWGYPELSFYIRVPFVTLNAVLDPFLIYGIGPFPALGVRGAALATLLAEVLEAIVAVYFLAYGKVGVKIRLRHLKPDFDLIKKIVKIGLPLGITNFTEASGFFILTSIISNIGPVAITTWTVYDKITSLFWWMIDSLNNASITIVGQCIGANKFERAEKAVRLTFIASFL
ncbi:MAG TPA: MATE family efflux transporter, partial [Bacteroidetes bacterium]|nr:MATE family efflux transporter [Bacteroidota bacterium]